jgi:1,4-alpha-glucan branching enzyme
MHELDCEPRGFRWLVADDANRSTLAFERYSSDGERVIVAMNMTPVPRFNYRIGVPEAGQWSELLNTDASELGGSGHGNLGGVEATPVRMHNRPYSLNLTLPPLGAVFMRL